MANNLIITLQKILMNNTKATTIIYSEDNSWEKPDSNYNVLENAD